MTHQRDTTTMHDAPRCDARTRSGEKCRSPAVKMKDKCRMHGGAKGSGAPMANTNARKHGLFTQEMREHRRMVREHIRQGYAILQNIS